MNDRAETPTTPSDPKPKSKGKRRSLVSVYETICHDLDGHLEYLGPLVWVADVPRSEVGQYMRELAESQPGRYSRLTLVGLGKAYVARVGATTVTKTTGRPMSASEAAQSAAAIE